MGFFSNIINSVKQATRSRFELNKDSNTLQLLLNSKDENYFTLEFDSMSVENLYDPSIQNAYKIIGSNKSLGALYIESIQLKHDQEWNVSGGSAFEEFFKEQFKNSELKFIDSSETDFTKFSKYQINYENEVGVIWINLNNIDVFIIDTKGALFNDLLEIYSIKNKELFIQDTNTKLPLEIQNSLTAINIREDFFSKEDR